MYNMNKKTDVTGYYTGYSPYRKILTKKVKMIHFRDEDNRYEELKWLAYENEVSVSHLIRMAIRQLLREMKDGRNKRRIPKTFA